MNVIPNGKARRGAFGGPSDCQLSRLGRGLPARRLLRRGDPCKPLWLADQLPAQRDVGRQQVEPGAATLERAVPVGRQPPLRAPVEPLTPTKWTPALLLQGLELHICELPHVVPFKRPSKPSPESTAAHLSQSSRTSDQGIRPSVAASQSDARTAPKARSIAALQRQQRLTPGLIQARSPGPSSSLPGPLCAPGGLWALSVLQVGVRGG